MSGTWKQSQLSILDLVLKVVDNSTVVCSKKIQEAIFLLLFLTFFLFIYFIFIEACIH